MGVSVLLQCIFTAISELDVCVRIGQYQFECLLIPVLDKVWVAAIRW
jgi:hypothetical protein